MFQHSHNKLKSLCAVASCIGLFLCSSAFAENAENDINARIERLEQELAALKHEQALANAKTEQEKSTATQLDKKGLKITSDDKFYEIGLRGNFQFDARHFLADKNDTGKDEFLARRLRPVLLARAGNASLRFMPDFAGSTTRIFDAYLDYKLLESVQFRIGKFKPPIALERLQSPADMPFIERGHPTNLAPSRDLGVMLFGSLFQDQIEYQLGVFNGASDLANSDGDDDENKDIVARIFVHPFRQSDFHGLRGLGVGIAGSIGDREGSLGKPQLGTYKTPAQQDFFRYRSETYADGTHWRLYPQAYWYHGPFGVLAEYAVSHQNVSRGIYHAALDHHAWQVAGSYILTGEPANFKGAITPFNPFDYTHGGWGAWELNARMGETRIADESFSQFVDTNTAARDAVSYGAGINWYLSKNLRLMANYDFTVFNGGYLSSGDRPNEQALFSRAQYRF